MAVIDTRTGLVWMSVLSKFNCIKLSRFALALILSASFAPVHGVELYGVIGDGGDLPETLVLLDMTDATSMVVLPLGNGVHGEEIAFNPDDGLIYHASGSSAEFGDGDDRILETIDPETLTIIPVSLSGDEYIEVAGLTYAGSDRFLAGDINPGLYSITNGVSSFIGDRAVDRIVSTGLAFIGSILYSVNRDDSLLKTLDPDTGGLLTSVEIKLPGFLIRSGTGLAANPEDNSLWALLKVQSEDNRVLVTIDPASGDATLVGLTDERGMSGIAFVESSLEMICELKVDDGGNKLHFETFNQDPALFDIWNNLFDVDPGEPVDGVLSLQGNRTVQWLAGSIEMGGSMQLDVKSDKNNPGFKRLKISSLKSKKSGRSKKRRAVLDTIEFVDATGSLNPNIANGGWHEVKIKGLDSVKIILGDQTVTGHLKELKVKLAKDSSTLAPIVKNFKLKMEGEMTIPDVSKGIVDHVVVLAPGSSVIATTGAEFEEKVKGKPQSLDGHTEAEHEDSLVSEIFLLNDDGFNGRLKERKGPCSVSS